MNGTYDDGDDCNYDEDWVSLGLTYVNGTVKVKGSDQDPTPAVKVISGGSGSTNMRTDGTTDKVYSYTISIPQNVTITPDDITVKIGNATANKHKTFFEKIGALSGAGDVQFTAAVTKIPNGVSLNDVKCVVSVSYILDGIDKKDEHEFTLE